MTTMTGTAKTPELPEAGLPRRRRGATAWTRRRRPSARGLRVGERGNQRRAIEHRGDLGVVGGRCSHCAGEVDHREVGQPRLAEIDALSTEDERRCAVRVVHQSAHQPGLARARLAREQHRPSPSGGRAPHRLPEGGQLAHAAHQGSLEVQLGLGHLANIPPRPRDRAGPAPGCALTAISCRRIAPATALAA